MGADIKDMDKDGWTALHCAAYSGHGPVVKLLLEMGADIKDMDKDGLTAILLAKDEGHEKVVQLLEEYMADGTAVVETDENVGGGGVSQEE
ncbi:ankyrin repeat-containing domain protein [Morchella snyderi]|nr:ankyrin repeat-containing domain protein [Morchella snyderi]